MKTYKKISILTCILLIFSFLTPLKAAWLTNVPRTLVQPNGDTLHCYITGDEFYNWLHDADNYTIVQNPETGWFVYADMHKGKLVPTDFVAGKVNPASKALRPGLRISRSEYLKRRQKMLAPAKRNVVRDYNTNKGNFNNLVVFIRFADDEAFTNSFAGVHQMFNDSTDNYQANSLFDYYKTASFDQLHIRSTFYPAPIGDSILSYQDTFPRNYYMPWSETNPDGYLDNDSIDERTSREHELLARASEYVANMIPEDLDIDYNNDGYVDNICFVVRGDVGDWNVLLWPHRWSLYTLETYIHGKRVYDFNFQLADATGYFNTSVLCHEMFHSLGAPDLYHYDDESGMDPVGPWDIMASNTNPPQQMLSWMKYKYGNWMTENDIIPIMDYGTYTIKPLNSPTPDKISYILETENPNEFIMIDFRNHKNPFDSEVPGRGIIFYRIYPYFDGNANYDGDEQLDEIYVFRTDGYIDENGYSSLANFRFNSPRCDFSSTTNPFPFYSNGDTMHIHIGNFVNGTDSMQFEYIYDDPTGIDNPNSQICQIYPNPAHNQLMISTMDGQPQMLQFFDITGRQMLVKEIENQSVIDVSDWAPGCYFVRVTEKGQNAVTLKFIKQ